MSKWRVVEMAPMPRAHSPAFIRIREAILAVEDADRKPLARLFGAMQQPEDTLTADTIRLLRAIVELETTDILRLQTMVGEVSVALGTGSVRCRPQERR